MQTDESKGDSRHVSDLERKQSVPRRIERSSRPSNDKQSESCESLESQSSINPPTEVETKSEEVPTAKAARDFMKRNKLTDAIKGSTDPENHQASSKSTKKMGEECSDGKWKKFWDAHRERFKPRDKAVTGSRSLEDVNAEADFQKAMKDLGRSTEDDPAPEKSGDRNNVLEQPRPDGTKVEAPPRRSRPRASRQKLCKPPEPLATDRDSSRRDVLQSDAEKSDENTRRSTDASVSTFLLDLTRSEFEGKARGGSSRKWSSMENLRAKLENVREGSSSRTRIEGLSIDKPARSKEKGKIGYLKSSLEKKMGSVEKILEDQIEKIWDENVEKHPWLLPIDTWIADHCKPSGTWVVPKHLDAEEQRPGGREQGRSRVSEPCLDVKYTVPGNGNEEPRIESRLEHQRKVRKEGSPKSEKSRSDAGHLISRPSKPENPSSTAENTDLAKTNGVLELKDVKHHDLFDKLRDNVREKMEDIHRYFQRTNRLADVNRRLKSQIWSSVVTIVLVEAKNLLPMDIDGLSDPYVKFRLGTEKYKSKVANKTLNPVWLEQFDLHLYQDPYLGQELEVAVWDRDKSHQDDLMGRTVIDLATLERETTHRLWRDLEDGSGSIFLLLTISGTTASETISDLAAHDETPRERERLYQRYSLMNTLQRMRDVGHLTVKVFRAQGLAAADLGGKSDPFCVIELVNARLQTQTEYKTLAPNWQKIFTFNVKDINSVLEVTVYDEDRDHKVEFLGKVAIPLLKIRNGEKRWYALKDKKLRGRAKGNSPQVLLEMTVVWNVFRAYIRTLNPKEKKYMEPEAKFKTQVFLRNVRRLRAIIIIFIDIGTYIQSCWEWESKMRSTIALVFFIFGCYYFEPYMIPGAALLILLKYYLHYGDGSGLNQWISGQVAVITGTPLSSHYTSAHLHDDGDDGAATSGDDDDDDDDKDKEEKKSLKERFQSIQEVTLTVQHSIGYIASLGERVKNLFNFTVPYLSYLAMILAILGAFVLYFIPVRYLILAWGVNKFSKKIVRPHSVPNNEILDLVSRVPNDEELLNYRELKALPTADCERGGASGSPGLSNLTRREQRKRQKLA